MTGTAWFDDVSVRLYQGPLVEGIATNLYRGRAVKGTVKVRMGLNSGPVAIVRDINDSMDVAGDGIVGAHRAMEAGDAGHILLTERSAGMVLARKAWAPYLHDLGVIPVKHGIPLRLYSLHTPEVGNPSPPRALLQHYARIAENKRSRAVARPRTWRDAAGDAAKVGWLTLLSGTSLLAVLFAVSAQFRDTVLTTYFSLTHSGPRPRIIQSGPTATVSGAVPMREEQGAARSRRSRTWSPASRATSRGCCATRGAARRASTWISSGSTTSAASSTARSTGRRWVS